MILSKNKLSVALTASRIQANKLNMYLTSFQQSIPMHLSRKLVCAIQQRKVTFTKKKTSDFCTSL